MNIETVGVSLKTARAKKSCSIEAASQHTRIPKKLLEALENNRFDEFPAPAYLRGFLKNYCDYLEIEFEPLWLQIEPPKPPNETPELQAANPPSAQTQAVAAAPKMLGFLLVAALLAAAILSFRFRKPADAPTVSATPAALEPLARPSGLKLAVEFRREVWLSVLVDGESKFEGRVPQGSPPQQWDAKHSISLRATDPGALRLTLNGARYKLPAQDSSGAYQIESP